MNTRNSILLSIAAILIAILIFLTLDGKFSFSNSTISNNFEDAPSRQKTISDVSDYIDYNVAQFNKVKCDNLPNNIENDRFPQLFCTQGDYYQRTKLGSQANAYVAAEDAILSKKINMHESDLKLMGTDKNMLINRQYAADYLDYTKANPPPISIDFFASIPTVAEPNSLANPIMLFPKDPGDFYGNYVIDIGQFVLLDGLKIHLNYSLLIISDTDGMELIKYQLYSLNRIDFNKMPTSTISIKIGNTYKSTTNMTDSLGNITDKQKKANLLNDLGFNGSMVYLFGNNGIYRFYNYYKINMFKVTRLTQE
jgi:hypothetical protein